jgi:hypothetical protein
MNINYRGKYLIIKYNCTIMLTLLLMVSGLIFSPCETVYAQEVKPGDRLTIEVYMLPGASITTRLTYSRVIVVAIPKELVATSSVTAELSQAGDEAGCTDFKANTYNDELEVVSASLKFSRALTVSEKTLLCTFTIDINSDAPVGSYVISEHANMPTGLKGYTEIVPSSITIVSIVGAPNSGDFDGDGIVTVSDVVNVAQIVIKGTEGLTSEQILAIDFDNDGYITMSDAVKIVRSLVDAG